MDNINKQSEKLLKELDGATANLANKTAINPTTMVNLLLKIKRAMLSLMEENKKLFLRIKTPPLK